MWYRSAPCASDGVIVHPLAPHSIVPCRDPFITLTKTPRLYADPLSASIAPLGHRDDLASVAGHVSE
jgi:hypothetical protein